MTVLALADRPAALRLLASGAFTFILIGTIPALYCVALPAWSVAFGLAEGQGGHLLSVHGAGAFVAVASGVMGLPLLTMRTGLALLAAGVAVISGGWGWGATLLGAGVAGMGYGVVSVVVNLRVLTEFGPHGPSLVGVVNAVLGLGAIVAPLLFLSAASRPGPVFWGAAFAAALVALGAAPAAPEPPGPRGPPPLRDPRLLFHLFSIASVCVETALAGYGTSALIDLGLPEAGAARLTSAFFAAFLAGRLLLSSLARIVAPQWLLALGLGGAGAGAALAATGWPATGFVMSGAFVGLCFPSFYVWGTGVHGGDPRLGSAILISGLVGATLGPALLGPILARTGEAGVFPAMAVVGLGAAAAFLPVARRWAPGPP